MLAEQLKLPNFFEVQIFKYLLKHLFQNVKHLKYVFKIVKHMLKVIRQIDNERLFL